MENRDNERSRSTRGRGSIYSQTSPASGRLPSQVPAWIVPDTSRESQTVERQGYSFNDPRNSRIDSLSSRSESRPRSYRTGESHSSRPESHLSRSESCSSVELLGSPQFNDPRRSRESSTSGSIIESISDGRSSKTRAEIHKRRFLNEIVDSKPKSLESKKGTSGKPVTLQCNYFRLLKTPTWSLYQYRVDFSPEIETNLVKKGMLKKHKDLLKGYIFDGTVMFLTHKLKRDRIELDAVFETTKENIKIIIKFVGVLSTKDSASLQAFNIILKSSMAGLKLQRVGRNFFDALAKVRVDQYRLELWPGYLTSIRQHEKDILLCAEITHKVMRTQTVYDILIQHSKDRDFRTSFQKAVIGITVLTDYNNRTYRVDDVDFEKNPETTFTTKNGEISFRQYYANKYNIKIRDMVQPLLISKSKARDIRGGTPEFIALVPELCRVTGLADDMRTNFQLMRELSIHTRVNPGSRIQRLLEFNKRLTTTPESVKNLAEWQMKLDRSLVQVDGRELVQENIYYGRGVKLSVDPKTADWTNQFRNQHMFTIVELKRWCIIVPKRNDQVAAEFSKCLQQVGNGLGFAISNPNILSVQDDRTPTYVHALDNCCNSDPQLIMCVVPNNRSDRYSAIKKMCCVDRAIPTQVMNLRTITPKGGNVRSLMSVATKVAIQMNSKLGAAPWMVDIPLSGLMTIGFDVCHDTSNKSKSYGAIVASMDLRLNSKYFSSVSAHVNGEELSNSFALNIIKAVTQYREIHSALPKRILIYRDGVGEGQIGYVHEYEINIIKDRLQQIYKDVPILMAFIIVTKRLNTRIFNNRQNPRPGTVVDDVITLPERYDFFLVSQNVNQGTSSPTMYNVLHDTLGLNPDKIQMLTYKMCHLYYNWFGTTRVPAVCQYAHKLATLVGQHLHQDPSHLLERQLYFL